MELELGSYHPIAVHFVVAFLVTGVALRLVSLLGRPRWTAPAAAALLIAGALASVVAVESGEDAHGAAERIPGARELVEEHEEWGERSRNLFLVVAVLEIGGLVVRAPSRARLRYASALVGIVGLVFLYEAAEHGGELVYSYAGGVGTRTGAPADTERLLIAGLYHQAMRDREAGDHAAALRLLEELHRRRPNDPSVQLLWSEALLVDGGDAEGALAALAAVDDSDEGARGLRFRRGLLAARVHEARGDIDAARGVIEALLEEFPDSGRLKQRLQELEDAAARQDEGTRQDEGAARQDEGAARQDEGAAPQEPAGAGDTAAQQADSQPQTAR